MPGENQQGLAFLSRLQTGLIDIQQPWDFVESAFPLARFDEAQECLEVSGLGTISRLPQRDSRDYQHERAMESASVQSNCHD
ncbi:hypothetical protein HRbin36_02199 [bacterium HR36]|nr:hypothetical protein HRbin36_02199 [bacterium HR36]